MTDITIHNFDNIVETELMDPIRELIEKQLPNELKIHFEIRRDQNKVIFYANFIRKFHADMKENLLLTFFKNLFNFISDAEDSFKKYLQSDSMPSKSEFEISREILISFYKTIINDLVRISFRYSLDIIESYDKKSFQEIKSFLKQFSKLLTDLIKYDFNKGRVSFHLIVLLKEIEFIRDIILLERILWLSLTQKVKNTNILTCTSFLEMIRIQDIGFPNKILSQILRENVIGDFFWLEEKGNISEHLIKFFIELIKEEDLVWKSQIQLDLIQIKEKRRICRILEDFISILERNVEINLENVMKNIEKSYKFTKNSKEDIQNFVITLFLNLPDFEFINLMSLKRVKDTPKNVINIQIDNFLNLNLKSSVYNLKVFILGDRDVGKTSLRHQIIGPITCGYPQMDEVDFDIKLFQFKDVKFNYAIWDLKGSTKNPDIRQLYLIGTQALLLIYSVKNKNSFTNLENWLIEFKKVISDDSIIIMVIGTKIDHRDQDALTGISTEEGKKLTKKLKEQHNNPIYFLETSAITKINLEGILLTLSSYFYGQLENGLNMK